MRAMIVGSGSREHSLIDNASWSSFIERTPTGKGLYCAPGNPGIAKQARCYPVAANNIKCLAFLAHQEKIDFTIVGPEQPLFDGIVDQFTAEGLAIFGPTQRAAMLTEGSKAAFKQLCVRWNIPTVKPFDIFSNVLEAKRYVQKQEGRVVIKADGPARGKGVIVPADQQSALQAVEDIMSTQAGRLVVIEKYLPGQECSFMVLTDSKHILPLPPIRDYKTFYPGAPNTGGLGCESPVPGMTEKMQSRVIDRCVEPVLETLRRLGCPFRGVLYLGLMLLGTDFFVLEANCRFGDPEATLLSFLFHNDLVPLLYAAANDSLKGFRLDYSYKPAACVVLTGKDYPRLGSFGSPIRGPEEAAKVEGVKIFHAGTRQLADGALVTNGGRILTIAANGKHARKQIDQAISCISIEEGMRYRHNIGR